jgi:hypothetical protein
LTASQEHAFRMPDFVILEHDHPHLHWDFMLEAGDGLRTWRLAAPPEIGTRVEADALADHRRAYLDYEGPISGGRGTVLRWDFGVFEWVATTADRVAVDLSGVRWSGHVELTRESNGTWEASFEKREH